VSDISEFKRPAPGEPALGMVLVEEWLATPCRGRVCHRGAWSLGSDAFCLGRKRHQSIATLSIYRPAARVLNCQGLAICRSGSNLCTAARADFVLLPWLRVFRIGISYEGTPQRSSVAGGLSRPKSGASLDSALFIPARRTWALPGAHRN
jgi:hypothetical protein